MKPLKPLATNLTKSLALLFFITLVNCKDDNVTSDHIAEHQHPPIARFAIDDLPEIEQVIGQFSISRTSRTMNTTFGDLDLSDIVQYINTDGKYTYTFKIRNSQDLASGLGFENLHLIRLPDDNGYLAYIVRWQPNAEWYQNNDYLFNLGDFTGQASRFDLEYNHLSTTTFVNGSPIESSSDSSGSREMQIMCYDVVTCGCTGVPYYCDCTQPGCERNFSTACTTSGGSPINDNTDTGSTGTHIGGSGTGQPPYVPGGDADVIVESPTYDDFIKLCYGESEALNNWIATAPYPLRKAIGLDIQGNCNPEALNFIDAILEAGPNAVVDYANKIIKDPSFIGTKADCVLNALISSNNNLFKTTSQAFTNQNSKFKLKFKVQSNNQGALAVTPYPPNESGVIEIWISPNSANGNAIDLASIIFHETIHAELHRIQLSGNSGPNPMPQNLYNWYIDMWEDYQGMDSDSGSVASDAEHYYMAAYLINNIASALRQFDELANPLENYKGFAWTGLEEYGKELGYVTQQQLNNYNNLSHIVYIDNHTNNCDE